MGPNHTLQVRRPIRADTVWEETRSRQFFVECASIFIRANSVYPHGIRHTAVFIMIVAFRLRSEWIMELKSITEGCFSVYNRTYIADLYGMRHTAESHTDHRFPPRYKKRLNSTTSLVSYKIEHRPTNSTLIIRCTTAPHCLHSIISLSLSGTNKSCISRHSVYHLDNA